MNAFSNAINKISIQMIKQMAKHPEKVSDKTKQTLMNLLSQIERVVGISENGKWVINWEVSKFTDKFAFEANEPYETCVAPQNVILDKGAELMLKLVCGIEGATPFDKVNAKIGVGSDTTPENPNQTGLLASSNKFYKTVESGYPQVSGRTMVFKATYDTNEANFDWNEFSIVNGDGVGGIALNRKVQNLGKKVSGIWSIQITISVTSNN